MSNKSLPAPGLLLGRVVLLLGAPLLLVGPPLLLLAGASPPVPPLVAAFPPLPMVGCNAGGTGTALLSPPSGALTRAAAGCATPFVCLVGAGVVVPSQPGTLLCGYCVCVCVSMCVLCVCVHKLLFNTDRSVCAHRKTSSIKTSNNATSSGS